MIAVIILLVYSLVFFLCQSEATKTLAITDVNNYIYIAKQIAEGKLLYKDIFLDNFPLAAYVGYFYRTITFGDMHLFRLTGTIEALALTWLLFWYSWKKSKSTIIAFLVAGTFSSSVIFMRTAFDQSGLYTGLLFFFIGYIFWERKNFTFSGIFIALAVLTKAYFFPLGLSMFIATVIYNKKEVIRFTLAGIATGVIILLPTIYLAFPQFVQQTFQYGLVRHSIESKAYIIDMFKYDLVIVGWLISAWFLRKKSLPVWLMSVLTPVFFLFYKDFYYVYFTMILLIATLACYTWLIELQNHAYWKSILIGYSLLFSVVLIGNSWFIVNYSKNTQILPDIENLYSVIKKENPMYLYGNSSIINGLSYQLGIPPYKNFVDYTGNLFENGVLDKSKITYEVTHSRTLIILLAIKQGYQLVPQTVMVDPKIMAQNDCKNIYEHPLTRYKGIDFKYLIVIKCYK